MAAVTYIGAVLLLMGPVSAIPCFEAHTFKKRHAYKQLTFPSVCKCAAECVSSPVCVSLNFDLKTKTCSLYDTAPADVASGNLQHWTKPPPDVKNAMLSRVNVCGIEDKFYSIYTRDCGEPPDVYGSAKVTKYYPLPSVTTYTCQPDFMSCDKKPTKTSRCQTSGLWEKVSKKCEQFHLKNNTAYDDYFIPCGASRKVQINISGAETSSSITKIDVQNMDDILLHVEVHFTERPQNTLLVVNTRMQWTWGSAKHVKVYWQRGQTCQICITMNSGTYKVKLNGTTLHTRPEPKKGIKASTLFINPSFKISDLSFVRQD